MIKSFADPEAELVWNEQQSRKRPPDIQNRATRKLNLLHTATTLLDLAAVRGNRLHALEDDREGQHSISINDQWRICLVWKDGDAHDVEIVDYH